MREWIWIATGLTALGLLAGCGSTDVTSTTAPATAPPDAGSQPADPAGAPAIGDGEGGVQLDQIGSFDQPVFVTQPVRGDDNLYVVEQCGRIQRLTIDGGEANVFLDLGDLVTCGGEQGLLSVAFAPDYERSGLLYVNYTDLDGDSRVVEYSRSNDDPATADPGSARELLKIDDFASNHNGGLLLFGPDDHLYLGMGDGGGAGDPERTAQNPDSPLGKLLRIDTAKGGYELAAIGLRNPWRYSFDRETKALWIGDVGQDTLEEIDALPDRDLGDGPPPNFGWSAFEGTEPFNADQQAPEALAPVYEYGRNRGCSVTGGYVVRDPALTTLYGRYLYGDFCEGELHSFTADPSRRATDDTALGLNVPQLSSFGEDAGGRLYVVSLGGPVYRLAPEG